MNELMVDSLLRTFVIVANFNNEQFHQLTNQYVEFYFSRLLPPRIAKQKKEEFAQLFAEYKANPQSIALKNICSEINNEFNKGQRVLFLVNILEFVTFSEKSFLKTSNLTHPLKIFIESISTELKISKSTHLNCENFVAEQYYNIPKQDYLVFAKDTNPGFNQSKHLPISGTKGFFVFLYIEEANLILFKYQGSSIVELNSRTIFPKNIYVLRSGAVISHNKKPLIYYSQVINLINKLDEKEGIVLQLSNVSYNHNNTNFGVKQVTITATSGEMIGVIGGSGAGKTTLLNIINGNIKPKEGDISLNGISYKNKLREIQKLIGFVPQDDSLNEKLTVFENLYLTAKLTLGNNPNIPTLVDNKLADYGLFHIKDLQVGTALNRNISGGQRKRLNIVSEIIREPKLLLVDEPTSGLSSSDSYRVMMLLKDQSLLGKLVIINIHQPSSEIYRLFDKVLVLDQGGYLAFYGNPIETIEYFKVNAQKLDSYAVECLSCGTLKPDDIFDILEEKEVDEFGEFTEKRKRSPQTWSNLFKGTLKEYDSHSAEDLPVAKSSTANWFLQFKLFLKRESLSKIRDREFFGFAFLIPILMAILVSFFGKYFETTDYGTRVYSFYANTNVPIFFLMSILANLFVGMIITSDSIIKDAKILKRESFLFLSRPSYINSKVVFFLLLSLIQSFVFTLITWGILQFKGIFISLWLILFLMSIFGNISGLIISTLFKSSSAAYIIVPFLIIPQIIFSGIVIPFDKLNFNFTNPKHVPLIGNITLSRWGVEALLVKQYKDNDYEKIFFSIDLLESESRIKSQFIIPKLFTLLNEVKLIDDKPLLERKISMINSGLQHFDFPLLNQKNITDKKIIRTLEIQLSSIKNYYTKRHSIYVNKRDSSYKSMISKLGSLDNLIAFKKINMNKGIEKFVLNREAISAIDLDGTNLIQVVDPIFLRPEKGLFKAHLFAPFKSLSKITIDTYPYNVLIILAYITILYIVLLTNLINRIVNFAKNNSVRFHFFYKLQLSRKNPK